MACPYFDPSAPVSWEEWPNPPRMPLGDPHSGVCRASGAELPAIQVRTCCNTGYARGCCGSFPGGDVPDAVRFGIVERKGGTARIQYVMERDHHPYSHGSLELREDGAGEPEPILTRQARAYLDSYLRRNR
ncbi:MAG TPA: hypothetical protein VGL72_05300 [Bryobacteraceae bacterium]|jgi:hypothetical protein